MEPSNETKSDNFKEVETRLEEMFAGIDDGNSEKPVSLSSSQESTKPPSQDVVEITKTLSLELDIKDATSKQETTTDLEKIPPQQQPEPHQQQQQQQTNNRPSKKHQSESMSKKKKPTKKDSKLFKPMIKTEKKKSHDSGKKEENNGKVKGPYIQIKPDNTVFVNNSSSEEYLENKAKKVSSNSVKSEINKLRGLYVSTLSTKYDADTTDVSWLCVFCKKGPHKMGLGDLYGPYIIQANSECNLNGEIISYHTNSFNAITNIKKKKSEPMESPKQIICTGMLQISDNSYEVWCHEDCIIWAAGVYLIGLKVIGLENAVWSSGLNECTQCALSGAIICCLWRGCSKTVHFPCAKIDGWLLDELNFKTYCPEHSAV